MYSFANGSDGATPQAGLVHFKGAFFGTTQNGGANSDGTVFKVTSTGTETVLHSFAGGSDGATPLAGLVAVGATLYGTTSNGGAYGPSATGTVFSITAEGKETVLHSFGSVGDGADPNAALIDVGGTLYGTTAEGGAAGLGSVFSITPSGAESVLCSPGGEIPSAGLVNVKGTLYGTTKDGGSQPAGTVFSLPL